MGIIAASGLPVDGTTADAADVNTTMNIIIDEINGNLDNNNIKTGAAIDGSKLANNSLDIGDTALPWDGWVGITDSWTYASATTITVPAGAADRFSVGDKIRFSQSGTKYFYVTTVADTLLTVTGGSDYTVANAAISSIAYSKVETPTGFPQSFAYTSTPTNFSVGNGTLTAKFSMVGKRVFFEIGLVLGSTSSVSGSMTFTLPVTSASYSGTAGLQTIGQGRILDSGTASFEARATWATTTTATIATYNASSTFVQSTATSSTSPMTWTTNDEFFFTGDYRAA